MIDLEFPREITVADERSMPAGGLKLTMENSFMFAFPQRDRQEPSQAPNSSLQKLVCTRRLLRLHELGVNIGIMKQYSAAAHITGSELFEPDR